MRKNALEDYNFLQHVGGLSNGDASNSTSYHRASFLFQPYPIYEKASGAGGGVARG